MAIDLAALDRRYNEAAEDGDESINDLVVRYCEDILDEFRASPEAEALLPPKQNGGGWALHLVRNGFDHLGVGLSEMTSADLAEILGEIFPRQISLRDPAAADTIIPEKRAFTRFLKREHRLPRADELLRTLDKLEPGYSERMCDPANFGIAKSFVMAGQQAGYDMTDEAQMHEFMVKHNASLVASPASLPEMPGAGGLPRTRSDAESTARRKKKRKQRRAGRKANRKRK